MSVLVTLWIATALLYPLLRRATTWFVDTVVLRRPDYRTLRAAIVRTSHDTDNIATLLSGVCLRLQPALSADFAAWREWASPAREGPLGYMSSAGPKQPNTRGSRSGNRCQGHPARW